MNLDNNLLKLNSDNACDSESGNSDIISSKSTNKVLTNFIKCISALLQHLENVLSHCDELFPIDVPSKVNLKDESKAETDISECSYKNPDDIFRYLENIKKCVLQISSVCLEQNIYVNCDLTFYNIDYYNCLNNSSRALIIDYLTEHIVYLTEHTGFLINMFKGEKNPEDARDIRKSLLKIYKQILLIPLNPILDETPKNFKHLDSSLWYTESLQILVEKLALLKITLVKFKKVFKKKTLNLNQDTSSMLCEDSDNSNKRKSDVIDNLIHAKRHKTEESEMFANNFLIPEIPPFKKDKKITENNKIESIPQTKDKKKIEIETNTDINEISNENLEIIEEDKHLNKKRNNKLKNVNIDILNACENNKIESVSQKKDKKKIQTETNTNINGISNENLEIIEKDKHIKNKKKKTKSKSIEVNEENKKEDIFKNILQNTEIDNFKNDYDLWDSKENQKVLKVFIKCISALIQHMDNVLCDSSGLYLIDTASKVKIKEESDMEIDVVEHSFQDSEIFRYLKSIKKCVLHLSLMFVEQNIYVNYDISFQPIDFYKYLDNTTKNYVIDYLTENAVCIIEQVDFLINILKNENDLENTNDIRKSLSKIYKQIVKIPLNPELDKLSENSKNLDISLLHSESVLVLSQKLMLLRTRLITFKKIFKKNILALNKCRSDAFYTSTDKNKETVTQNTSKQYNLESNINTINETERENIMNLENVKNIEKVKEENYIKEKENKIKALIKKKSKIKTESSKKNINKNSDYAEFSNSMYDIIKQHNLNDNEKCLYIQDIVHFAKEKEAVSEETKKKLANLFICIDWDIPQTHLIQNRLVRGPTTEEQEALINLGVSNKRYNHDEDKIIKRNWKLFCKTHDLDEKNPTPFLKFYISPKQTLLKFEERKKFVQFLGKDLPHRSLDSLYRRFKSLFREPNKLGRFTPEEDELILIYCKNMKDEHRFVTLSKVMKRSKESVERRYRSITHNSQDRIKWTLEKDAKLIRDLLRVTGCKTVEQLRNIPITLHNYKKIGNSMKESYLKIKLHWLTFVYPRLFATEPLNIREIRIKIIDLLNDTKETDWARMDWDKFLLNFQGITKEFIWRQLRLLLQPIPKYHHKDLKICIELLNNMRLVDDRRFLREKYIERYTLNDAGELETFL